MTQAVETKFNFKARKITDEAGNEVGKGKKQAPLTVALPQPTAEEIIALLSIPDTPVEGKEGVFIVDKQKDLILDAVREIVRTQAKSQLDDVIEGFGQDDTLQVSPEHLDYDKLTLEYIANLPPAQRGAKAIPEEDWAEFYADYIAVMVAVTGKPEAKIVNHINIFKKPTKAKSAKDVLTVLSEQLDVYISSSKNLESTGECAERLQNKFKKWVEEENDLDLNAL